MKSDKSTIKIELKTGEYISINNVLMQTDRKVRLTLISKTKFLVSPYVMLEEDANKTGLHQLYYVIQQYHFDLVSPEHAFKALESATTFLKREEHCYLEMLLITSTLKMLKHLHGIMREREKDDASVE